MRLSARVTLVGAILVAVASPAAHVGAQGMKVNDTTPVKRAKPSADLITQDQLQSRTFSNAYTAIEALRSNWLRARNLNPPPGTIINPGGASTTGGASGSGSQRSSASQDTPQLPREASGIQVYLDGTRVGGIDALKAIPIASVYSIRRISGTDAQARFGIGHSDGVIFIATGPNKGGF